MKMFSSLPHSIARCTSYCFLASILLFVVFLGSATAGFGIIPEAQAYNIQYALFALEIGSLGLSALCLIAGIALYIWSKITGNRVGDIKL